MGLGGVPVVNWRYELDVKTALRASEGKDVPESRKLLADALRTGPKDSRGFIPPGLRQRFARIADDLEKAETVPAIDRVLDRAYDLADQEGVWMGL